jgi:hypothetical protein
MASAGMSSSAVSTGRKCIGEVSLAGGGSIA